MSIYHFTSLLVLLLFQTEEFRMILLFLICLIFVWVSDSSLLCSISLASSLQLSIFLFSFCFLTSSSLLWFYICFEGVLVPIFFLILTFGYCSEKILATVYLLIYTVIGSLPLLLFVFSSFESVTALGNLSSPALATCLFITFGAKSPLFWLHAWLPKAHTEAPLFGSILLSGVLLKLGGYGIFLLSPSLHLCDHLLIIFCLFGSLLCCFVTLRCWDSKLLVAYSSVVHIGTLTAGLLCGSSCSVSSALVSMVAHSLVSPVLFWAVNLVYACHGSRSFALHFNSSLDSTFKGLFSLLCGLNFGLPPFLGFWGELFLFLGLGSSSTLLLFLAVPLPFFVLLYSLVLITCSVGSFPSSVLPLPCQPWLPLSAVSLRLLASTCLSSFSY